LYIINRKKDSKTERKVREEKEDGQLESLTFIFDKIGEAFAKVA
jgi:hypothetical protein